MCCCPPLPVMGVGVGQPHVPSHHKEAMVTVVVTVAVVTRRRSSTAMITAYQKAEHDGHYKHRGGEALRQHTPSAECRTCDGCCRPLSTVTPGQLRQAREQPSWWTTTRPTTRRDLGRGVFQGVAVRTRQFWRQRSRQSAADWSLGCCRH